MRHDHHVRLFSRIKRMHRRLVGEVEFGGDRPGQFGGQGVDRRVGSGAGADPCAAVRVLSLGDRDDRRTGAGDAQPREGDPGRAAVERGHSVLFTTATAVLGALATAEREGQLNERVAFYTKPKLLIVDELGYLPFEANAAHLFFQLVSRRYERGSMLVTSNRSVAEWGGVFGDAVVATAILDRLLHHSHVITIRGDSYRLRTKRRAGLVNQASANTEAATN